jgi:2'-5' RNA ligase superfamily
MTGALARVLALANDPAISGDSGMVYLHVPQAFLPAGYPAIQPPHITVVYLGHITPQQFDDACHRVKAAAHAMPPLHGTMGGLKCFPPSPQSDNRTVVYAPVEVDGIYQLRAMLSDLASPDVHPFRPHVTLAYLEPGDAMPPPVTSAALDFSQVHVRRGSRDCAFAFSGRHSPHLHGGRVSVPAPATT